MPGKMPALDEGELAASIVDAIEAMARSLLAAMIRNGTISLEDALTVFDDARALIEPEHGLQSPGAIMIRSIYRDLESAFRESHPVGDAAPPAQSRKPDGASSID